MGLSHRCRLFTIFSLVLIIITCTTEQPYSPDDRPGKIMGLVKPEGIIARVDLFQGIIIQTTAADSSGYFVYDSVAAGTYNLEFSAYHYGRQVLNDVIVYPNRITTTPDIFLKPFPEQISTIIPVDGAQNFSLDAPIQIDFNTLMDHPSVENSLFLYPQVNGRSVWEINSGKSMLSFYPEDQYISNSSYVIVLTGNAKTSYGDSLAFDFVSHFETEGVKITTTIPEDQATFISPQSNIYVYFNSKMDRQSVEQNFSITPIKIGNFKWLDSRKVCFQPGSFLASHTLYTITIVTEARDVYNTFLLTNKTFSFETEPLRITSSFPTNGATAINRSIPITITFNTFVNQQSAEDAFLITPTAEGWSFQWSDLIHFQYSGSTTLQANTFYNVTIDTTCSDAWGNLLPSKYSFIFKTGN